MLYNKRDSVSCIVASTNKSLIWVNFMTCVLESHVDNENTFHIRSKQFLQCLFLSNQKWWFLNQIIIWIIRVRYCQWHVIWTIQMQWSLQATSLMHRTKRDVLTSCDEKSENCQKHQSIEQIFLWFEINDKFLSRFWHHQYFDDFDVNVCVDYWIRHCWN